MSRLSQVYCPKCETYVGTVRHEYIINGLIEYRCSRCDTVLRIVHLWPRESPPNRLPDYMIWETH